VLQGKTSHRCEFSPGRKNIASNVFGFPSDIEKRLALEKFRPSVERVPCGTNNHELCRDGECIIDPPLACSHKNWSLMTLARVLFPFLVILLPSCIPSCNEQGNILSKRTGFQTTPVPKAVFDAVYRDSCGAGGVSPAGETAFLRGPYLQKMTDESVEILWTSDSSEASSVVVRKPDGSPVVELDPVVDEQSDRQEFAQYVTKVAGLESETIYCYEVRGENGAWLEATGFRTAPGPDSTTPIKIVALGDLGQRTPDQYAVLSQIEQVQYDLVLIPGDLAYDKGTLSDHEMNFFQVYEHIMRSIPRPAGRVARSRSSCQ
jgi:hypothetical protein